MSRVARCLKRLRNVFKKSFIRNCDVRCRCFEKMDIFELILSGIYIHAYGSKCQDIHRCSSSLKLSSCAMFTSTSADVSSLRTSKSIDTVLTPTKEIKVETLSLRVGSKYLFSILGQHKKR